LPLMCDDGDIVRTRRRRGGESESISFTTHAGNKEIKGRNDYLLRWIINGLLPAVSGRFGHTCTTKAAQTPLALPRRLFRVFARSTRSRNVALKTIVFGSPDFRYGNNESQIIGKCRWRFVYYSRRYVRNLISRLSNTRAYYSRPTSEFGTPPTTGPPAVYSRSPSSFS